MLRGLGEGVGAGRKRSLGEWCADGIVTGRSTLSTILYCIVLYKGDLCLYGYERKIEQECALQGSLEQSTPASGLGENLAALCSAILTS